MTRKRQGQNIYELFSKECNNCNGLGHNANIAGKDQIKPSALNAGLIKSEPQDLLNTTLNTNNKIKFNEPVLESNEINSKGNISKSNEKESYSEKTSIRKEPEHIKVEMNDDEELVFSNLGLSPALILDNLPSNNNILLEVVKPTKDHSKKTDLTITDTENVNQKRSQELNPGSNSSTTFVEEKGHIQLTHEEEGSPSLEKRQEDSPKINPENISRDEPTNIKEATQSEQEAEDPRRRRRRSSNETDNKNITTEAEKGAKETKSSEQEEEVEDPRRRRRRSSATS
jgi:ribonuclease E